MHQNQARDAVGIHGPIFISYRQSDGTQTAEVVARVLRAAGVPVWRDKTDLPPGDTTARLQEAIDAGISGAVIVITDHVKDSQVMREVEVPRLLELHRADPRFALQIVSRVKDGRKLDYSAPDRLLELEAGTLKSVDQQPANPLGLRAATRGLAELRIARHREAKTNDSFAISVQTRNEGRASDLTDAMLDLRLQAVADGRLPSRVGLEDLQWVCGLLPTLLVGSHQSSASVSGGAHLSAAFAVGAALPSTRVNRLRVRQSSDGAIWDSTATTPDEADLFELLHEERIGSGPESRDCAVYVDVVPRDSSDLAFDQFWSQHSGVISEALILRAQNRTEISAEQGPALAANIIARISSLWGRRGNGEVHLLLRVPFSLAVLLGRLSNTIPVVVYEWSLAGGAHYVAAMRIESGALPSAVREVLLPGS